jgi:hypothetical protein
MGRSEIRELIRKAQAAEIAGELDQAARLLTEAARHHLDHDQAPRAAVLLRHGLRLAPGRSDASELLARAEEAAGPRAEVSGVGLEARNRGPVPADPSVDCWCSFCCQPKSDAGTMIAGPAGAFICASCVGTAGELLCVATPTPVAQAPAKPDSFIEAAVVLSKELGWSLADVRSLSPEEIARALEKLEGLRSR